MYAEGGKIEGRGEIIRKDGTREEFTVTTVLTQQEADRLNKQAEKAKE